MHIGFSIKLHMRTYMVDSVVTEKTFTEVSSEALATTLQLYNIQREKE